jgi:glycosyltransferase involved in cell wall biosynthesis
MKKKLLVFHPALAPYRVDFFNALSRAFDASFYFNLPNVADQEFDQLRLAARSTFQPKYLLRGFEFLGRSIRTGIVPVIRRENPDVILCSEYGLATFAVYLHSRLGRRQYAFYTLCDDSIHGATIRRGLRAWSRNLIAKHVDGVIFHSREVCDWHRAHVTGKAKALEMPIIHDDAAFRRQLADSLDTANKNITAYELQGKKVILFVGRLVAVKNLPFLLDVVGRLEDPAAVLVAVGDGVLADNLVARAKQLHLQQKVRFVGRKEGAELFSWYAIAQILVLPSTYERYGAVVNEALLGGCRVLCSQRAGAASLVTGDNGKLFDPYSKEELLSCLSDVLKAVAPVSGKAALRSSLMPFTFEEKVKKLIREL